MSQDLRVFNRQRVLAVDLPRFREIIHVLLSELLKQPDFDITVHLVNASTMGRLNQLHLDHEGSTDVITLDYGSEPENFVGEIYVCLDEALLQACRFRVHWTQELVRYLIHAILHLRGHDDQKPAARKRMKSAETRLLRRLDARFRLRQLAGRPKLKP